MLRIRPQRFEVMALYFVSEHSALYTNTGECDYATNSYLRGFLCCSLKLANKMNAEGSRRFYSFLVPGTLVSTFAKYIHSFTGRAIRFGRSRRGTFLSYTDLVLTWCATSAARLTIRRGRVVYG